MRTKPLHFFCILIALFISGNAYATPGTVVTVSPNDTICQGVSATFTCSVTLSRTYTYKWMLNTTVAGSTTSTYTSSTLANHDTVYCVITNLAGDTVLSTSNKIGMTVDSLPVIAPITGLDSVCIGSSLQLSDATPGGVWSVTVPAAATISTTGLITGIAASNTNRAVYKMTNNCGTDSVRFRVRIHAPAGPITGVNNLCMDSTTLYTTTPRGTWSTSDSTIGKFINQFGQLTAYAPGTITVYVNVVNACGATADSLMLTIINCDTTSAVPVVLPLNRSVRVFPNPSSGTLSVSLDGSYPTANCMISNIVGEKVKEFTISAGKQAEITLKHSGMYFITVTAGNEKYTTKVVVQ